MPVRDWPSLQGGRLGGGWGGLRCSRPRATEAHRHLALPLEGEGFSGMRADVPGLFRIVEFWTS